MGEGLKMKGNPMPQMTPDQEPGKNGVPSQLSVADEIKKLAKELALEKGDPAKCKQVSERLQQVADQLLAQEAAERQADDFRRRVG